MPKHLTQYDILISCPGDVKQELEIIEKALKKFNEQIGKIYNIHLNTVHWSKDAFPQLGGKPQSLLNTQIVKDSDAAIAVFWTRFGTPTDDYDSGTEEEIEVLVNSNKQVFLYFSNCDVNPKEFEPEQYKKVQDFKEKSSIIGLYNTYDSIEEFEEKLLSHLGLYFIKKDAEDKQIISIDKNHLSVVGVRNGKTNKIPELYKSSFLAWEQLEETKQDIMSDFQKIKSINLVFSEDLQLKIKSEFSLIEKTTVVIDDKVKSRIRDFAKQYDIKINSGFFDLGNLEQKKELWVPPTPYTTNRSQYSLVGSDDEKDKYNLIIKLYNSISFYTQFRALTEKVESKYRLELAIENSGESFDEDIDVKLFMEEGKFCFIKDIPIPGDQIIEHIYEDLPKTILEPTKSASIKEYDYSFTFSSTTIPGLNHGKDHFINEYTENLDSYYIYETFNEEGEDIITFNQGYLKAKGKVHFPSVLLFNEIPNYIRYEISSKHSSDIIKGSVELEVNE
ncbi:hypothetical protein [Virgibacillus salexigens]|uniref:DUF4062 domain-containing protein n=1 Tax=Virgibacillus massiliensis TaxID=1462526 RepID=A0A024QI97_9BACI|nr:hypothetical protein [Virgibacillus massiliensis]CDQ41947.1 hypothetical protein BN990_04326 [Virgibacillus massiliensis]